MDALVVRRGNSSVGRARAFSMHEVPGSIPCFSSLLFAISKFWFPDFSQAFTARSRVRFPDSPIFSCDITVSISWFFTNFYCKVPGSIPCFSRYFYCISNLYGKATPRQCRRSRSSQARLPWFDSLIPQIHLLYAYFWRKRRIMRTSDARGPGFELVIFLHFYVHEVSNDLGGWHTKSMPTRRAISMTLLSVWRFQKPISGIWGHSKRPSIPPVGSDLK